MKDYRASHYRLGLYNNFSYKYMSQQYLHNEYRPYSIERASTKGPLHLHHTRKIHQLQSKANFFQGQINPIYNQNISLKEQLMQLAKMVSCSTDILRNLLPNQEDSNKKLKLQLANLEEIASMIRVDWKEMEKDLAENSQMIQQLQSQKSEWRNKYEMEHKNRLEEVDQLLTQNKLMKASYQQKMVSFQKQIALIMTQNNEQKQRMKEQFADKLISYDLRFREFDIYKRQAADKYQQYEKCILRLRGEIEANLITFEQNKKHLKGIYDKLTADKLAEQAEGYEMMLRIKEEQKDNLVRQIVDNQQESKKTAAMKQMQIAKLNQQNYRYKEEIGSIKDDLWKKQIQIDQQFADNQQMLKQVSKLTQKNKLFARTMEDQQKQFTLQKMKLEEIARRKQKQMMILKEQGSSALKKMMDEKHLVEKTLMEKQTKLKQVILSIKKSQDEWEAKTNLMKQEWGQQKFKLQTQMTEKAKQLQQESQKLKTSLLEKQQLKKQSEKNIKSLQRQYNKEKEYQNKLWNSKMQDLQQKNKEEIIKLQCRHERALSDVTMNANEEMRQMVMENQRKLSQQQSKFMTQIEKIKIEGEQVQKLLRKAEVTLKKKEEQVQKIKIEHTKTIRQIQQQRRQEKQKMTEQMQSQMKEFQRSMESKQTQFQKSMEKKEAQLHSLKTEMENQIKMLKESNAIESIENRYIAQIFKLKGQFDQRYKQKQEQSKKQKQLLEQSNRKQIQLLSNNYKQQIAQLTSYNQNKFNQLQSSFRKDMTSIAEHVEINQTYLNDRLLSGFSSSLLQQMSNQQQKQYILTKINSMKNDLSDKDKRIAEMEYQLELIHKDIQKKVKIRKQELQKQKQLLQKNCVKRMDDMNSECRAKVLIAEKQKLQHTQLLYQQFETMKQKFEGDYGTLHKKYNELQILFEQRPSRAQDLTKIKELTNMQNKFDIQIQTYHKKMETANQIVKYLNLELSNYKDTYDIFGPNQDGTGGIIGHSSVKSPPKINDSQYVIGALKSQKYDSEIKVGDQIRIPKQSVHIRKWNDSPTINELKVFEQNQCNQSMNLEPSEASENKQIRSSNLISDKNIKKERFKTQKFQKVDNQAQIIINAQHFIKLIKGNKKEQLTGIQEVDNEVNSRRRSYRKRVIKRYPTMAIDHYF